MRRLIESTIVSLDGVVDPLTAGRGSTEEAVQYSMNELRRGECAVGTLVCAMEREEGLHRRAGETTGEQIGIDWATSPFDVEQLRMGMDVELEHGMRLNRRRTSWMTTWSRRPRSHGRTSTSSRLLQPSGGNGG